MIVISPDPQNYDAQFSQKKSSLNSLLNTFAAPPLECFASPPLHYRQRAEFKIWHQADGVHYAVFDKTQQDTRILVTQFPIASERINAIMPPLHEQLMQDKRLQKKLFQVDFLSTQAGDLLATLIYHRPLDEEWATAARGLSNTLQIKVIGRSRNQKVVLSDDFVQEVFTVNGRDYRYHQLEGSFSQPNAAICQQMLAWASTVTQDLGGDLLELYCGNGNFTLPLAAQFNRVLATEISKPLEKVAQYNCQQNGITNVSLARLSAEEVSSALQKQRAFKRLEGIDLDDYRFSTVFVDPPRAGLDAATLAMVSGFSNIVYISCNPETLAKDLQTLAQTHKIARAAFFDQFPYTQHIESGVLLARR